jgi:hypothetical protein
LWKPCITQAIAKVKQQRFGKPQARGNSALTWSREFFAVQMFAPQGLIKQWLIRMLLSAQALTSQQAVTATHLATAV